jgi:hypothetical protein
MTLLALTNTDYLIYGMAAFAVLYLVIRPFLRRQKDPLDAPLKFGLAQQRAVERDMNNALVELAEMARQVSAQLETRAARLQELLDRADQTIARLERLTGRAAHDAPAADSSAPTAAPPEPPAHAEVYRLADGGLGAAEIATRLDRPRGEVELILALRPR